MRAVARWSRSGICPCLGFRPLRRLCIIPRQTGRAEQFWPSDHGSGRKEAGSV